MRINLFKKPQHRKYGYIPMYYDQETEELEQRLKRARTLRDESPDGMKARISSGLQRQAKTNAYRSERQKALFRSNMMLLIILFLLIFGTVFIVQFYLPELMEFFE